MFITKGTLYFLFVSLMAIAGIILLGIALSKPKSKPRFPRKLALALGILAMAVSVYTGIDLTRKAYNKIRTTVTALKNFPETVGSDMNKDTTDYVRILKRYEPERFKGKVPESYYTENGFYDWWRFPLVYPYSVSSIDEMKIGGIVNDSGKTDFDQGGSLTVVSPEFVSLMYDGRYFIGETDASSKGGVNMSKYFIFNFQNGKTDSIKTPEELTKKLDEVGFRKEREFVSVRYFSEDPFSVLMNNFREKNPSKGQ